MEVFFVFVSMVIFDTKRTMSCYKSKGEEYGPEVNKHVEKSV